MVCCNSDVRPPRWRCENFLILARDTTRSNNIAPDRNDELWIDAIGDICLRHTQILRDVRWHHVGASCSPQTGWPARLRICAVI
jgi:hypothetical protein